MAKMVSVRLDEEEIAYLEKLGGKTKGIKLLIEYHKKGINEEKRELDPAERFYQCIILPTDQRLRETYQCFLELFIEMGGRKASLDYYAPHITGRTGFDEKTVRKHFRKLSSLKFVRHDGLLFRPTLRLKEGFAIEDFEKPYRDFVDFLQAKGVYRDIGMDLWERNGGKSG
ncbi:MAG: hypothetical protein J7J46_03225 [Candidatus Desulfofervidus sp.]|nr:hypothetical protein [Candidatus Desulfofervidus sp.]